MNIIFTNGSNIVEIDLIPNFNIIYPDLPIIIKIELLNTNSDFFQNIPLYLINQAQTIFISPNNKLAFTIKFIFSKTKLLFIVTFVTFELLNGFAPKLFKLLPKVTKFKFKLLLKVSTPIYVTLSGNIIEFKLTQLLKA